MTTTNEPSGLNDADVALDDETRSRADAEAGLSGHDDLAATSAGSAHGGGHGGNGHGAYDLPPDEPTSGPWHRSHFFIPPTGPWPDDVPKNQDLDWWRYRDDPKGARRAELRIAFCWIVTMLAGLGLAVTYCVAGEQSQAIGAFLVCGFLGLGVGLILWARDLLPGIEVTAHREHQGGSGDTARGEVVTSLSRALEPMARRPFLLKILLPVGGVFGVAAFFPLASLGPRPHTTLYHTGWGPGSHVVSEDGRRIKATDIEANGILTVFPEGQISQPQSATVLINIGDSHFEVGKGREGWTVGSVVAFSKICTHAGCPASLYNVESHQLVCPCHQSTFDVLLDCKPVFGPAARSLPQLPLSVDDDGYLISQSDYTEPVGPGFWNRG
jgi:ubiquinol-cytochrome c reductase iron-sulfur subunit